MLFETVFFILQGLYSWGITSLGIAPCGWEVCSQTWNYFRFNRIRAPLRCLDLWFLSSEKGELPFGYNSARLIDISNEEYSYPDVTFHFYSIKCWRLNANITRMLSFVKKVYHSAEFALCCKEAVHWKRSGTLCFERLGEGSAGKKNKKKCICQYFLQKIFFQ